MIYPEEKLKEYMNYNRVYMNYEKTTNKSCDWNFGAISMVRSMVIFRMPYNW